MCGYQRRERSGHVRWVESAGRGRPSACKGRAASRNCDGYDHGDVGEKRFANLFRPRNRTRLRIPPVQQSLGRRFAAMDAVGDAHAVIGVARQFQAGVLGNATFNLANPLQVP